MRHSQRGENILQAVRVKRHSRDSLDQGGQNDEVCVAIYELSFGRRDGHLRECHAERGIAAGEGWREINVGCQPGVVRQKITDCNVAFAVLTEFRNVLHHRIVHPDSSLLFQLHHCGRSGNDFGQRRHIENCVDSHWFNFGIE